ncbi:LPS export ABC transporter ATP-binding protein [Candidatus Aminicenantes bacterium AC-335-K20]|jgi:lipopolysaccharide export system ATP-binding protein|nr:LPS export ABC transporter ATP-binding protein [SCandidatus Aminicenantes bacterium Aminicenantia_JdfR_composite]MCP2596391.1 LPS export ABC transporter ATP-binding protein [Candidatus Aminicenantes bacterium AC-335-G13]MCP2618231.1 LPS export ABC transporter ATP-binding protein [Candidatus Aminicenantes bacterium AC-335-A11]MCP2619491.1 LPS export ABC transporter ATP-binding protein [Candidatus Aminicenantes bacterium AC-335-K20]
MEELRAEKLSKSYGNRKVVNNVSLKLKKGEIVGLLGSNGAGKTTIFHIILGNVSPESGRIFLNEEELTQLPMYMRVRKGIGFLPQEPSAFRGLTVKENLYVVCEILSLPISQTRQIIDMLIQELGLEKVKNAKAFSLSGGERRRLEIARALIPSPKFLLLDEPFTGIDPIAVMEIQRIILALKEKSIGILLTDHNVRDTLKITDRAYIIHKGSILKEGSPHEIAADIVVKENYLGKEFSLN